MDILRLQKEGGGYNITGLPVLLYRWILMKLGRIEACMFPNLYNSISTKFFREWIQDSNTGP